jgi:hypothetical protein
MTPYGTDGAKRQTSPALLDACSVAITALDAVQEIRKATRTRQQLGKAKSD